MAKPSPFNGPIPGESFTLPPKTYPFDRPPKNTNPEKAANEIFEMIMEPKAAKNALMLMEWGIPISVLSEIVLQQAFGEGLVSAYMLPILAGPVGAMLGSMAKAADIKAKTKFEEDDSIADVIARIKGSDVTDEQVEDAIEEAKTSQELVKELPESVGGVETDKANSKKKKGGSGMSGLMSKVGK